MHPVLRAAYACAHTYLSPAAMPDAFAQIGYTVVGQPFAGAKDTVAVALHDADARLIVVRGTVTGRNWRSNLEVDTRPITPGGPRAHAGFLGECDVLLPWARTVFAGPMVYPLTLDLAGHSAGAAAATALAIRRREWEIFPIRQVTTFGSPRVGLGAFARAYRAAQPNTVRVVHEEDIVPTAPPVWLGYRHVCPPLHIDDQGQVIGPIGRGLRNLWRAVTQRVRADLDGVAVHEHFMAQEIPAIQKYVARMYPGAV